jgi:membrane fusion protein, type I secretion system
MTTSHQSWSRRSIRRNLLVGLATVLLVVGGVGGWAATTEISGAVIAPGTVVVDTNVKKVQHPTGGIVGEILVRDGDQVTAGQVVLRLDDTMTRASLAIVTKGLTEFYARKARLEAERDGIDAIVIPDELAARSNEKDVAHVVNGAQRLFELRKSARVGQKERLQQRVEQLNQEIVGLEAQAKAKSKEIKLIKTELSGARRLWAKNLIPISKMTNLEREATRVSGEEGQLISAIARAKAKIAETELEIIQIDRDLASEVARELREVDSKIGEFVERKIAAQDQLSRIEIRAPQSGTVHQSTAHTIGGVISAGETVMVVVPKTDGLTVEAKVAPQDIDQVRLGQSAILRFSAFNQRTTPEIGGEVSRISADITADDRSTANYYTIRIAMPDEEIAHLGNVALLPGMPVEVFIKTGDRKVISYLVKPLSDQLTRAFRER